MDDAAPPLPDPLLLLLLLLLRLPALALVVMAPERSLALELSPTGASLESFLRSRSLLRYCRTADADRGPLKLNWTSPALEPAADERLTAEPLCRCSLELPPLPLPPVATSTDDVPMREPVRRSFFGVHDMVVLLLDGLSPSSCA